MKTTFTEKTAKTVFQNRLAKDDIESGEVFDTMYLQDFVDSMAPSIDHELRAVDEKKMIEYGKEQKSELKGYTECLHTMCYAVLDDVVELAEEWWNEKIKELEEDALDFDNSYRRFYRVYSCDKDEDDQETKYFGENFVQAKNAAARYEQRLMASEREKGYRAILAYNDFDSREINGKTLDEIKILWDDVPDEFRVARAVWYGQTKI